VVKTIMLVHHLDSAMDHTHKAAVLEAFVAAHAGTAGVGKDKVVNVQLSKDASIIYGEIAAASVEEADALAGMLSTDDAIDLRRRMWLGLRQVEGLPVTGTLAVEVQAVWSARANKCNWKFVGFGYCFPTPKAEMLERLGDWVSGTLADAEEACCANEYCQGFHLEIKTWTAAASSNYVLINAVGVPGQQDGTRRECWLKASSNATTFLGTSSVARGQMSCLVPLVTLAATCAACVFGAGRVRTSTNSGGD